MSTDPAQLAREIIARCGSLGFALAGVCAAEPTAHGDALRGWLGAGKHGPMAWLADNSEVRADPRRLLEGARSLVIVADQYAERGNTEERIVPGRGRVARYARGDDYHTVMKKRLHALCDDLRERYPGEKFRAFVDTAPVLEREHAARAGLGWIGKHTLLIHPRRGSWLLLGGIVTTLELRAPLDQAPIEDHCGTCTRCIDACPTDAITPYSVDATRCISTLTIEQRGAIDPEYFDAMARDAWLFGCDICQEVCPHNSVREDGVEVGGANSAYGSRNASLGLLDVLGWTEADRRSALARSAMKRAKLDMLRRNALIGAIRAAGDPAIRAKVQSIAADDSEPLTVRGTALAVLERLDARR